MTLLFLAVIVVAGMTTLCHVTAVPCPETTASANCSFESGEPCSSAYAFKDEHGLSWKSGAGQISSKVSEYYGYYDNVVLAPSPYNSYMYLRGTDDSRAWGLWTDLTSPPVRVYGGCLQYIYHNSVCGDSSDTRQMKLKVILRSNEDRIVREHHCVNDSEWHSDQVSLYGLEGSYRIVFSAQHHGWTNQTVAIDHVLYSFQSCSLRDDASFQDGDCDWENADMCGYQLSEPAPGGLGWEIIQDSQLEGVFREPAKISGLYRRGGILTVSGKAHNTTSGELIEVSVTSPKINIRQSGCLVLRYYSGRHDTENGNVTALVVKATTNASNTSTIMYEFPSTLGEEDLPKHVPLLAGEYSLMFTARLQQPYGSQPYDLIAIDDVEIFQKACDYVKCNPKLCDETNKCNSHGTCIGQGLKHNTCLCNKPYVGKSCQFNVPYSSSKGFTYTEVTPPLTNCRLFSNGRCIY